MYLGEKWSPVGARRRRRRRPPPEAAKILRPRDFYTGFTWKSPLWRVHSRARELARTQQVVSPSEGLDYDEGCTFYASVACGWSGSSAPPPLRAAAAFLAAGAAHENTGFRPLLIFGLNARACFPQFTQRACTARGALGDRRSGRTLESYVHHGVQVEVVAWSATSLRACIHMIPPHVALCALYVSLRRRSRTHA